MTPTRPPAPARSPRPAPHRAAAAVLAGTLLAALTPAPVPARAETFLTTDRPVGDTVKIGLCAPLQGVIARNGNKVRAGVEACLQQVNARGGIHGRRIALLARDDRYLPMYCLVQTRQLVNEEKVFALCTYFGTASTTAVLPMITEAQVPLVGSGSAADWLVRPTNPYYFSTTPTYSQEVEALVDQLATSCQVRRIAVFYQDDGFGQAIRQAVERSARAHQVTLVTTAQCAPGTVNVNNALEAVINAQPEAVILGGSYPSMSPFVQGARARQFDPIFCTIGQVGTEDFLSSAGKAAEGVYLAQPTPDPRDGSIPLVSQYQQAMRALGQADDLSYYGLLGYLNACVLVEGLRLSGPQLTTASFLASLERMSADLGGLECVFSAADHQGRRHVYLTRVEGGQLKPVDHFSR